MISVRDRGKAFPRKRSRKSFVLFIARRMREIARVAVAPVSASQSLSAQCACTAVRSRRQTPRTVCRLNAFRSESAFIRVNPRLVSSFSPRQLHLHESHHQDPNQRCRKSRDHVCRVMHAKVNSRKPNQQEHRRANDPHDHARAFRLDSRRPDAANAPKTALVSECPLGKLYVSGGVRSKNGTGRARWKVSLRVIFTSAAPTIVIAKSFASRQLFQCKLNDDEGRQYGQCGRGSDKR